MILDDKLSAAEAIVLDGAVGSEIARLGGVMDEAAWCGVANRTHPAIVRRVHQEYIRAGCDVLTTNTFATCRHVLEGAGLGDETVAINTRAVELAREALDRVGPDRPVAIAGSMSNTLAWIPGSFSPDVRYVPTPAQEMENYREMASTLATAGVDLIVAEMMIDAERATRLITAAMETGLPVWVGLSGSLAADGSVTAWDIRKEEPLDRLIDADLRTEPSAFGTVVEALVELGPQVVGVMHTKIESIGPALEVLFRHWDGPVMVYPEVAGAHPAPPEAFAASCRGWVERGVQIVGGCCGTTVEHIHAMVKALPDSVGPRVHPGRNPG
ncbi:MAG: homocysteine S-methyltransferase family protein [Gammaproteobacteria bacterium]|nr:homocysteine S-methyltransferase family protein [Gammaproteobacteria bacterium]